MSECYHNIRFSLSDKDGELRFTSFDIVKTPVCRHIVIKLREYLMGRTLDQVDPQRIRLFLSDDCEECVPQVIGIIEHNRRLFGHVGRQVASGRLLPAPESQVSERGAGLSGEDSEVPG